MPICHAYELLIYEMPTYTDTSFIFPYRHHAAKAKLSIKFVTQYKVSTFERCSLPSAKSIFTIINICYVAISKKDVIGQFLGEECTYLSMS